MFRTSLLAAIIAMQIVNGPSVWDGVYTAAQARRGRDSYAAYCSKCHAVELTGANGPPLKGGIFLGHWLEDSLAPLFSKMKKMPPNNGEKPSEGSYLDILALILEANTYPPGNDDLKAGALPGIRVTGKDGPGPVPDFALVEVAGCLAQGPGGAWQLNHASEPVRTRNPDQPDPEELKTAAAISLATHSFQLLSPTSFRTGFRIEDYLGNKMHAKGFLIRIPSERLNVTWLEPLASTCP